MKSLSPLLICLVISLTVAGKALALQNPLAVNGINKVLQMKIAQEVTQSLGDEAYFQQQRRISLPEEQDKLQDDQPEIFSAPDCLCHLLTRVL